MFRPNRLTILPRARLVARQPPVVAEPRPGGVDFRVANAPPPRAFHISIALCPFPQFW